jgi:FKBP-type peptidyl-prolyl cis-trans isomerase SlyD
MPENLQQVADNIVVTLDYTMIADGEIVGSTRETGPIQYLQGHNNIIPALERELAGLNTGESKQVFLPAADAYGEHDPKAQAEVGRDEFPPNFPLEIGSPLRVRDDSGYIRNARIAEIGETSVRLDLNHPLAGKDLSFHATVLALRPGTPEEIARGGLGGGCSSCSSASDCTTGSCG